MNIKELIDELLLEVSVYHPMPDFNNQEHVDTLLYICEKKGYDSIAPIIKEVFLIEAGEQTQAEKMGLVHLGRGYYGPKKGAGATHLSKDGKIVPLKPSETPADATADIDKEIEKKQQQSKEDEQDPFIAAAKGDEKPSELEKEKTPAEKEHDAAKNTPQKVLNDPAASSRSIAVARAQQSKMNTTDAEEEKSDKGQRDQPEGFEPIEASKVVDEMPDAKHDTFVGKSDLSQKQGSAELQQFNTDINRLAELVKDAKEKGEKAPNINLCMVSIPGTNLYCDDNLGIPREQMPQFKGKPMEGSRAASMPVDKSGEVDTEPVFKEMLKQKGINVVQTEVPADKLKATQSDLVGAKVVGMLGALNTDPNHPAITAPIYISRDGYVIDGHHRWAAVVAYNAAHPNAQIPMRVSVIDMDIKDAIPMANNFAEEIGIAAKKADANKESTTEKPKTQNIAKTLKGRSAKNGEVLDTETTPNGSILIGTEHGENNESTKEAIKQIETLPKDTKVMFVGEGAAEKDENGKWQFFGEQAELRDAILNHFDNAKESSWDENASVWDSGSPLFSAVAKDLGGSQSKASAALWSNMVGQGDEMAAEDYLDDEGKQWLIDQAKKGGSKEFDGDVDWDNLTDQQKEDLYQLNYRDDVNYGETEISKAQQSFNNFRQKELDRKIEEAEKAGYTVIAAMGNSHVDLWRKRNKPSKGDSVETKPAEKLPEPKEPSEKDGGQVYSIGGGYYSDTPNGPAQYIKAESLVHKIFYDGDETLSKLLFEAVVTKTIVNTGGKAEKLKTIPVKDQPEATKAAMQQKAAEPEESEIEKTDAEETESEEGAAEIDLGKLSKDAKKRESQLDKNDKIKLKNVKDKFIKKIVDDVPNKPSGLKTALKKVINGEELNPSEKKLIADYVRIVEPTSKSPNTFRIYVAKQPGDFSNKTNIDFSKDSKLGALVRDVMGSNGVQNIATSAFGGKKSTAGQIYTDEKTGNTKVLKPQPEVIRDASGKIQSIKFGNTTLERLDENEAGISEEEKLIRERSNRNLDEFGKQISEGKLKFIDTDSGKYPDTAENRAFIIQDSLSKMHEKLLEMAKKAGAKEGSEAMQLLERLKKLSSLDPNENPEDWYNQYNELFGDIAESKGEPNLGEAWANVAEIWVTLGEMQGNGKGTQEGIIALLPESTTLETVDVIKLGRVTNDVNRTIVTLDGISVKKEAGGASAMVPKIKKSTFKNDKKGEFKKELLKLTAGGARNIYGYPNTLVEAKLECKKWSNYSELSKDSKKKKQPTISQDNCSILNEFKNNTEYTNHLLKHQSSYQNQMLEQSTKWEEDGRLPKGYTKDLVKQMERETKEGGQIYNAMEAIKSKSPEYQALLKASKKIPKVKKLLQEWEKQQLEKQKNYYLQIYISHAVYNQNVESQDFENDSVFTKTDKKTGKRSIITHKSDGINTLSFMNPAHNVGWNTTGTPSNFAAGRLVPRDKDDGDARNYGIPTKKKKSVKEILNKLPKNLKEKIVTRLKTFSN